VRFWDSSAVAPLIVNERESQAMREQYRSDPWMLVWWGTIVECASALARLERTGSMSAEGIKQSMVRMRALSSAWQEIQPVEEVKETAMRFLRVHNLRAGDAFQLAAAFLAAERRPGSLEFVCLDERLRDAASREGFGVVP
jgi:predicted nucleic acid-binding protein